MRSIWEVIADNRKEAIDLLRDPANLTEDGSYILDFAYGNEPYVLLETGSNSIIVDAKVINVELVDKGGTDKLTMTIGAYSNDPYMDVLDEYPVTSALGYTEENVYEAMIEDLSKEK